MPGRNCQWLHRSCITIADVPSRNCQCMCKRTVKRPHSEGVPFWKKRVPNDPITVGDVLVVSSLNHSIVRFFISVWVLLVSQFKLGPRTLPRATKNIMRLWRRKKKPNCSRILQMSRRNHVKCGWIRSNSMTELESFRWFSKRKIILLFRLLTAASFFLNVELVGDLGRFPRQL